MKPLALLLLLSCAEAKPTLTTPSKLQTLAPVTHEIIADTVRIIDNGKRFEHVVTYRDGRKVRFIYEVPKLP
jgi:hypothetical protein